MKKFPAAQNQGYERGNRKPKGTQATKGKTGGAVRRASLGPGWNHVVREGSVVKAASPPSHNHATSPVTEKSTRHEVTATSRNGRTEKSAPKVTVGPKQAPVIENTKRTKVTTRAGNDGGSSNGQQLGNKRHGPNLTPRLQNKLATSPAKQKFATPSAKQKIIMEMAYFRSCKVSSATSNSLIPLFPILINFIVLCIIIISLRHIGTNLSQN